jgi:4-hydroxybenzoate polyprenyltransferase
MIRAARYLFLSSRPLSWVNTAFPFGIAYYAITKDIDWPLVVGFLFFLIPYNLLMYGINDVFDYESDLRNPRKGGIEGALLPPDLHRLTVIVSALMTVPFLFPLIVWGTPVATGVLALALFMVVVYSAKGLRFKEIPFLDSVTSSLHFVLPAVYGLSLAGGSITSLGALLLASFFVWGMASHAFGAVQDVVADREAGVSSIATVIGAKGTVRLAFTLYVIAAVVLMFTPWPLPLIAIAAIGYLAAIAPWWSIEDSEAESANRGWKWFLFLNFLAGAVVVLVVLEWWRLTS